MNAVAWAGIDKACSLSVDMAPLRFRRKTGLGQASKQLNGPQKLEGGTNCQFPWWEAAMLKIGKAPPVK